jgi:hypothetical protein
MTMDDLNTNPPAEPPISEAPIFVAPSSAPSAEITPSPDEVDADPTASVMTEPEPEGVSAEETIGVEPTTASLVEAPVSDVDLGVVRDEAVEQTYPTSDTVIPSTNVHLTDEVMSKKALNGPISPFEVAFVPETHLEQENEILTQNPNVNADAGAKGALWEGMLKASSDATRPLNAQFEATVNREGSEFHQGVKTADGLMGLTTPSFKDNIEKMTPEAALLRVRSVLGQGSLVSIPLVHSGLWIQIRTPSNGAIIELRRQLMEERITLGRITHGMVLANASAYTQRYILDMAMDHLQTTTLKDGTPERVRSKIVALDLPLIAWGLACAIYPSGFEYTKALLSKEGIQEAQYETGLIDVKKLLWVDNVSMDERQRRHMANRQRGSVTDDMVELHQKSMRMAEGRTISIKTGDTAHEGDIKVTLGIPSVARMLESSESWILGLTDIIERTLTGDRTDDRRRNEAILEHARVTQLRQYAHMVTAVTVMERTFDDKEWLAKFLDTLSENEEASQQLLKACRDFIDDATVALIAIPSSNGAVVGPNRFPRLIPIDALSVFFTLFMQRASRLIQ